MNEPKSKPPIGPIVIGVVLVVAVILVVVLKLKGASDGDRIPEPGDLAAGGAPGSAGSAGAQGALPPDKGQPVVMKPLGAGVVAIAADVHSPAKLRRALAANEWLRQTLKEPLGRGFVGPWAGLLATRGEDIGGAFAGIVLDHLADRLLADPFRVLWFSGATPPGAPAIVVHSPGGTAKAGYAALDKTVRRGTFQLHDCPGAEASPPETPPKVEIARWLIAEQAVFAAETGDKIVIARTPAAAAYGVCAAASAPKTTEGADFELSFDAQGLGRDTQALFHLAGLAAPPRLAFAVDGDKIVPVGIAGQLATAGRLAKASPPEALLRAVPEDIPALALLQLGLPQHLETQALRGFLKGEAGGGGEARTVALLWNPRGRNDRTTEIALLWSRASDGPALEPIFSGGGNQLLSKAVCGIHVFASTEELLSRIERTCGGGAPSLLHGAPAVVAGLEESSSVSIGVNPGKLLSQLVFDAYEAEAEAKIARPNPIPADWKPVAPPPPASIEAARRRLEELPFIGLQGSADDKELVSRGFRS